MTCNVSIGMLKVLLCLSICLSILTTILEDRINTTRVYWLEFFLFLKARLYGDSLVKPWGYLDWIRYANRFRRLFYYYLLIPCKPLKPPESGQFNQLYANLGAYIRIKLITGVTFSQTEKHVAYFNRLKLQYLMHTHFVSYCRFTQNYAVNC